MADSSLSVALKSVLARIQSAAQGRTLELGTFVPRLVAVSKTRPVESIVELYHCGHHHFGENYVQEFVEKANNPKILELKEIKWHFIGHLQRNKCNNLTAAPNLYMVETIDSSKLATALNNSWAKKDNSYNLKVMVQVNTSEEANKSGCTPEMCSDVVRHILETCPKLQFVGLMTIGALARSVQQEGSNRDFELLVACRKDICEKLNLNVNDVELSMGMSADFEQAIQLGSTNIRVGSTIFGARENKPSA